MVAAYEREINSSGEIELLQLRNLVRPGQLAIDVGANVGTYAHELARLTGRVIAFEPNPVLAATLADLGLKGVEVRQVALSSTDGSADLQVPLLNGLATLRTDMQLGDGVEHVTVPTARLDGLNLDKIAFIKIDVEGFEEEVLAGAAATIARDLPILLIEIEERHNPGGLARIEAKLNRLGYACYFYRAGAWRVLADFIPDQYQRVDRDMEAQLAARPRRSVDYINNFLFVPANAAPVLESLNG